MARCGKNAVWLRLKRRTAHPMKRRVPVPARRREISTQTTRGIHPWPLTFHYLPKRGVRCGALPWHTNTARPTPATRSTKPYQPPPQPQYQQQHQCQRHQHQQQQEHQQYLAAAGDRCTIPDVSAVANHLSADWYHERWPRIPWYELCGFHRLGAAIGRPERRPTRGIGS